MGLNLRANNKRTLNVNLKSKIGGMASSGKITTKLARTTKIYHNDFSRLQFLEHCKERISSQICVNVLPACY